MRNIYKALSRPAALISCSDKTNLEKLSKHFIDKRKLDILSTGGSYSYIKKHLAIEQHQHLHRVEDVIGFPEILGGRVKTLHPLIFGGILANRSKDKDIKDMTDHNVPDIKWVVCNLYPFDEQVTEDTPFEEAIELIDIGGVSLLRAAAKNCENVNVLSSYEQYDSVLNGEEFNQAQKRQLGLEAFMLTSYYDTCIHNYFSGTPRTFKRTYTPMLKLKYGCNPHQYEANISTITSASKSAIKVLNGSPGYINFLDAFRGWQLVKELKEQLREPAAASMKHTSPAGAAVYIENHKYSHFLYNNVYYTSTPTDKVTATYIRARNCDPLSSFGDFVAISDTVTVELAKYLKGEVSDGIIAPAYEEEALDILRKKKKGNYVVIQVNPSYEPEKGTLEVKEMFGFGLVQSRNEECVTLDDVKNIKADQARRDLVLASLVLKYAESNTIAAAYMGQLVGLGSGQQSRLHATKLCMDKAKLYTLRHDYYTRLSLEDGAFGTNEMKMLSRQERINAELEFFGNYEKPSLFSPQICLASDAFFPFRDNIDYAAKCGVRYIAQPGGSVRDEDVFEACREHGIDMVCHGKRMFTH